MRVIIIGNGKLERLDCVRPGDYIICADGGANQIWAKGILPKMVIGDFDSLQPEVADALRQAGCQLIFDQDQSVTDIELAIREANKLQVSEMILLGATGTRLDHTLANILSLLQVRTGVPAKMVDAHNEIWIADATASIAGKPGDNVSVIPLADHVTGLTYRGLFFGLENFNPPLGWFGVSNKLTGNDAAISVRAGKIIVIKAKD